MWIIFASFSLTILSRDNQPTKSIKDIKKVETCKPKKRLHVGENEEKTKLEIHLWRSPNNGVLAMLELRWYRGLFRP